MTAWGGGRVDGAGGLRRDLRRNEGGRLEMKKTTARVDLVSGALDFRGGGCGMDRPCGECGIWSRRRACDEGEEGREGEAP